MRYTKTTTKSANLIAHNYPLVMYDEIDGDAVVRIVHVLKDGRVVKESLDQYKGVVFGSLCDEAPKLEHNYEGAPGLIEESTREEFEDMWAKAVFVEEK